MILVIILVACSLWETSANEVWDLGCHSQDRSNKDFIYSAGNYKPSDTSAQDCTSACALRNVPFKYAATEGSSYCYCSNTTSRITKVQDSKCSEVCTGDVCSGPAYIRVFNTNVSIEGLSVHTPDVGLLLQDVGFGAAVVKGETNASYTFDFGDKSFVLTTCCNTTHKYTRTGVFEVKVSARNSQSGPIRASGWVSIESSLGIVRIKCPEEIVETGNVTKITAYTTQGTHLTAKWITNDQQKSAEFFNISDATMVQVGSKATFGIISGSPKTDGSFINPTSMFNHDGYVMAWEVYAAKTGTVKLQVYRPVCTNPAELFCPLNLKCIPAGLACEPSTTFTCPGNGNVCLATGHCLQGCAVHNISFPGSSTPKVDYKLIQEAVVNISKIGYNIFTLPPHKAIEVQAGDVIGWATNSSAGDLAYETSMDEPQFYYPYSSFNIVVGSTLSKSGGAIKQNISHVIRAHLSQASYTSKELTFSNAGIFSVSVIIKSQQNKSSNNSLQFCTISVQERITKLQIEKPTCYDKNLSYPTGRPFDLVPKIDKGSNVTYTWNIGNITVVGDNSAKTQIDTPGLHKVTVMASNNISACAVSTIISIQNPVGSIELVNQSRHIEVTIPANFTLQFTSGTNITVEVYFDGVLKETFSISEATNTIREITHIFPTGGTRKMRVKAFNNVNDSSETFPIQVKGKIGQLTMEVEPQLTSDGLLDIATGQQYEITIYSTLDIPINYSLSDGISNNEQNETTSKGKVSFLGKFESKDFTGNITINASANGELVPLSIPVRIARCGSPAIFKPANYSKESPLIKTMATPLELKYRSVYKKREGCSYGELIYNWKIFKLQNNLYVPVGNYDQGKGEVLTVPPMKEGNYTINLTLTYTGTGHQYLYETFFDIRKSELFCLINGGSSRGVPYESSAAINLDGEGSVDPDQPEESKLKFKWSCKLKNDNNTKKVLSMPYNSEVPAYCNSTSFQDIPIEPHAFISKLPIKHFSEDASYVFQLQVSKDSREKTCQQEIIILPEENPSISIRCKSNCKDKVNTQDRLVINAVCDNCKNNSDLSVKWSLTDKEGVPDTALTADPSTTSTGWNKMSIVLRENKLRVKKHYYLRLEVTRRSLKTVTQYYFVTTSPPYGGSCQVLPEEGYNIESKYHISCKEWQTEDPQILYEFHFINERQTEAKISSLPPDMVVSTLWYYGPFHKTPSSSLPIGRKKDDYRLPIVVKIYNRFRAYSSYNLSAIVKPLSNKQTTAKIEDISKQLKEGSLEFNPKENAQNVLQLVTAASSFINNDKDQKMKDEKIKLRKLMVDKLSEINSEELPMIAEKCNALSLAIEDKNEVKSDTQITATNSLKRSSEALRRKAKIKGYHGNTPVQLEETAQVVFTGISHTFSASETTTKDFLDQVIENLGKTGPKSRNWSVRIRERDGEDSADAAQDVVSTLYGAINQLSDAIQENKVEGENETLVTTKTFGMQLSKTTWSSIGNKSLPVRGEEGEPVGSFVLPRGDDLLAGGDVRDDDTVGVQIVRFPENPVRWDKDLSAFINSSVIGLELRNSNDKEIPVKKTRKDIEIVIPVKDTNVEHHSDTFRSDTLKTFHFRVDNSQVKNEPLLVHIKPNKPLNLYLSSRSYPTTKTHDIKIPLPCLNDSLPWPFSKVDNYTMIIMDLKDFGENLYLGLEADELVKPKGLETPNDIESVAVSEVLQVNYTIDIRSVGCKFWSEKSLDKWSGDGCRIGNKTNYSSVHCLCNHLTFFGSIVVKPNPIRKPTAKKFVDGYATFVAVCVIFIVYFIALIWARRKDRADLIKVGACPLPDNDPTDQFRYEITLWTSMRRSGGTTSKVSIILDGEDHDSEARTLEDPERKPFQRGSVDTFLLTTPYLLGPLPYIRIWHDNSGGSWFLSRVMVIDLQTDEHYYFICNRWLAVDEDDGQVERLIPLASKEELTEFQHLFVARTRRNLSDNHLWFSVFARPASSRFTRVQRLTCCLCLMMMSMMTNAMWYKNEPSVQDTNNFAGIKFSWQQVFIGVVSSLIIFPVNLIVVQIFRSVRPKPHRITHRKIPMPPKLSLTVTNLSAYNKMKDCSDDSKGSNNSLESMHEKNNSKMRLSINDVHTDVDRISFTSSPLLVDRRQSMWDPSGSTKLQRIVHWFKRHSSLPYYFIYVAWFLAVTFTLGAAIVIILYGMEFGNSKSLKWLFSSTVSFIQDVIITQPLKVLATAIFFALIVKKPDKGEFEITSDAAQLAEDEDWLYQAGDQTKAKKRKKKKLLPPDQAKLIAMRSTRMKERKMYSVIREIGFFYMFLCLVMMIAYTHKDYYSFIQTDNFKKMFVENFREIKKDLDFWKWSHEHLVPNLFPDKWYNDQKIPDNGFASDHNSQMVGGARLRHIRIKPGLCEVPASITFITRDCFSQYSINDEDHSEYTKSWKNVTKYTKPVSRKDVNWRYQTWDKLDGYPVWAELNTYAGGGFVHVLEPGMDNPEKLKKLEKEFWIDRHSRAVVTEFTVYNAQTNLFTIATLVAEFPATGGVIPFVNIQTARLYNFTKDYMVFIVACECLFVLYILFFSYKELRKLYKEGSAHFKQFWNIVDLVIVSSAGFGIGLYIYRLLKYTDVLEKSRNAPFQFKSFQLAGYWDEMYTLSIAILVTFATIKLNKLLRFNKRMSLLSSTLKNAAFSLMMFGLIFGILFLAFTLIGTVVFGTAVRGYRKSGSAFTSLLSLMLGKTSFLEMNEANRVLGPVYFFCFMFLVSMVLINLFLSIIIDSYHEVKRDLEKQNNEYEIVDFIIERFKMWSGIGKAEKPVFKHRHVRWDVVESKVKSLNALTGGRVDHVSKLESRIEKLIERTDLLFTEIFPEKRRRPTKAMRHRLPKEQRL